MESTNVLVLRESKLVYPALHRLNISQSGSNKFEFDEWRWMELADLAITARGFFTNLGGNEDWRDEIFTRYGVLNNHKNGTPLVTWVLEPGPNSALKYQINGSPPDCCAYHIFVPARWGSVVVDMASRGVEWVKAICEGPEYKMVACIGGVKRNLVKRRGLWKILEN